MRRPASPTSPAEAGTAPTPTAADIRRFDHLPIHHGFAFARITDPRTVDDPSALAAALESLARLEMPCLLVADTRLRSAVRSAGLDGLLSALVVLPDDTGASALMARADLVIDGSQRLPLGRENGRVPGA